MPIIRGAHVGEIESAGRIKSRLDVLLYADGYTERDLLLLDELETLRDLLNSFPEFVCGVRLIITDDFEDVHKLLTAWEIRCDVVQKIPVETHELLPEEMIPTSLQSFALRSQTTSIAC